MNVYPIFEIFKTHAKNGLSHLFHTGYLKGDWTNPKEPKSISGLTTPCIILGITLKDF